MVDLKFNARAKHFIPLALLRHIADAASDQPPEGLGYIGEDGLKAIKGMLTSCADIFSKLTDPHSAMHLVSRGRLSVQRVEAEAWEAIHLLANNGGWEELDLKPRNKSTKPAAKAKPSVSKAKTKLVRKTRKTKAADRDQEEEESSLSSLSDEGAEDGEGSKGAEHTESSKTHARKRKIAVHNDSNSADLPRRSRRKVGN